MILTREIVEDVLDDFMERCEIARPAGIAYRDYVEGVPVPEGWWLDQETYYWLPPNFSFRGSRA